MDALVRDLLRCVRRRARADEELTVEEVSRELGFTRQYVSGKFHRITGKLLSDYLKEKRLMKAARLLRTSETKITQVSRLCGFDSENYFRQQFKLRFGMSPRQFRNHGSQGGDGRLRRRENTGEAPVASR
jgi:AraC-like DNA-binding protein